MAAIAAISLCPIGSPEFDAILGLPQVRDSLILAHHQRETSKAKWESEKTEIAVKSMYVNDYGLRLVAASMGAKPPDEWLSDHIFKPKTTADLLDLDFIRATSRKKKSPS